MMRFEKVLGRLYDGRLSCEEAAEVLGMSVSSFYRWRQRYEAAGIEGLADGRIGKASGRRAAVDEVTRVLSLFETRYFDFDVRHFHERLADHGIRRSYSWTKNVLQAAGKVPKAKRRGAHRRRRPRRPLPGMMLHQDGSRHEWVPGQWDLVVTMDDATSELHSAFFVVEEGTMSSFRGLQETIGRHGLFGALYADRGSHDWLTGVTGEKVDTTRPTQVKRALDQLGIELIAAYSPEARGRSERMFGTLQGRLPQELRLAGITSMDEANRFLAESYLARINARFREAVAEPGSAFVPWTRGSELAEILCIQEERTVGNDNTVRYHGKVLQIPADRHRHHYVKCKVRVHQYPDGNLAVFHGPRRLARYDSEGSQAEQQKTAA